MKAQTFKVNYTTSANTVHNACIAATDENSALVKFKKFYLVDKNGVKINSIKLIQSKL